MKRFVGLLTVALAAVCSYGQEQLQPYVAFAWPGTAETPRVQPMLTIGRSSNADPRPMIDPTGFALDSAKLRPGRRVAFMWNSSSQWGLWWNPADVCRKPNGTPTTQPGVWHDAGIADVRVSADPWFAAVRAAGGSLDMLAMDDEGGDTMWGFATHDPRWAAIQADPRFPALAARLGFSDLSIVDNWWGEPTHAYLKWNSVTDGIKSRAMEASYGAALWRSFPRAHFSNYGSTGLTAADAPNAPDANGHPQYLEDRPTGTMQSPVLYAWPFAVRLYNPANLAQQADRDKLWADPVTSVAWMADTVRGSARARPSDPICPWVAQKSYWGDDPATQWVRFARTPYWEEMVYQAMLSGASNNLLLWGPLQGDAGLPDARAMDEALRQLEQQTRGHRLVRVLTTDFVALDAPAVYSAAMTDDGRTVCRVTFRPGGANVASVILAGKRYSVGRQPADVGVWFTTDP